MYDIPRIFSGYLLNGCASSDQSAFEDLYVMEMLTRLGHHFAVFYKYL
jgi:hypothetical protein